MYGEPQCNSVTAGGITNGKSYDYNCNNAQHWTTNGVERYPWWGTDHVGGCLQNQILYCTDCEENCGNGQFRWGCGANQAGQSDSNSITNWNNPGKCVSCTDPTYYKCQAGIEYKIWSQNTNMDRCAGARHGMWLGELWEVTRLACSAQVRWLVEWDVSCVLRLTWLRRLPHQRKRQQQQ